MTVRELREKLEGLPDDTVVMLKHELVGDENYAETVNYKKDDYRNPTDGVLWIGDVS